MSDANLTDLSKLRAVPPKVTHCVTLKFHDDGNATVDVPDTLDPLLLAEAITDIANKAIKLHNQLAAQRKAAAITPAPAGILLPNGRLAH